MQRCTVDLQHSVTDIDGMRLKSGAVGVQLQKESAGWKLEMRSMRQQVTHRLHNHTSRDAVTAVDSALQPSADADTNNLNGGRIHNAQTRHRGSNRRSFCLSCGDRTDREYGGQGCDGVIQWSCLHSGSARVAAEREFITTLAGRAKCLEARDPAGPVRSSGSK
jgi:hypothetical protein